MCFDVDSGRDTRPHYIRCIKPNDNAEPDEVSRVRVMEQLRYGGVLEAVRVARSGYPVRLPHKVWNSLIYICMCTPLGFEWDKDVDKS